VHAALRDSTEAQRVAGGRAQGEAAAGWGGRGPSNTAAAGLRAAESVPSPRPRSTPTCNWRRPRCSVWPAVWARSAAEFGPLPQLRLLVDRLLQGLTLGGRAGRTPLMVVSALSGLNVLVHLMPHCLGPPPRDSTGRCWRRRRPRTRSSESSGAFYETAPL
jgi:hypothetical protein